MLNFVRFCELLVIKAKRLKRIELTTGKDGEKNKEGFAELSKSLEAREISLKIEYSDSIHDREIRCVICYFATRHSHFQCLGSQSNERCAAKYLTPLLGHFSPRTFHLAFLTTVCWS